MRVHSQGVWLCYTVLIVWCATAAVCSPVGQRPAARKRLTSPRVVIEPTTETTTLPAEDTSSPLIVSLDDGVLGSIDSTNGTFNDTVDLEDETASTESSDVDGDHDNRLTLDDNLKFACEDPFLRKTLALRYKDCVGVEISWSDVAENEEQAEEQDEKLSAEPEEPDESEEPEELEDHEESDEPEEYKEPEEPEEHEEPEEPEESYSGY